MSDLKIYLDGEIVPEPEAKVSVFDHGLLYGDGVFEGIRFYGGRVFKLEEHIDRLYASAHAILLEIHIDKAAMTKALLETIRANDLQDGYIRLVVTRGKGGLGLNPFLCETPSVIIIASSIKLYPEEFYQKGLALITCSTRRPTPAALSPQVKSLNYLNNVMAKVEAIHGGCQEGLMLNENGLVAECTGDNLFIVKKGKISTPPIWAGALDGITRQVIFDIAAELGIEMVERNLTRYDIWSADECFLTGTAAEAIPVVELDKRTIGSGQPGEVTERIVKAFRELAGSCGTPIYG